MKNITIDSNGVLLTALYSGGVILGSSLMVAFPAVRHFADRFLINEWLQKMSITELAIIEVVVSLGVCTAVFSAGLSLVGYPMIYFTPLFAGLFSGIFLFAFLISDTTMETLKCIVMTPLYCAAVCALLIACDYASIMSGCLIREKGGREAGETKKYTIRIILLTLIVIAFNVLYSMLIVLFRYFN